jgi:hypothetical protein
LIRFEEQVLVKDPALDLNQIRSIEVVDDGIVVRVTIAAPLSHWFDGVRIADFNEPANNRSVFQAKYSVRWESIPDKNPKEGKEKEKDEKEKDRTKDVKDRKEARDGGRHPLDPGVPAPVLDVLAQRIDVLGGQLGDEPAWSGAEERAQLGALAGDPAQLAALLADRLAQLEQQVDAGPVVGPLARPGGSGSADDASQVLDALISRVGALEQAVGEQMATGRAFIERAQRPEVGGDVGAEAAPPQTQDLEEPGRRDKEAP